MSKSEEQDPRVRSGGSTRQELPRSKRGTRPISELHKKLACANVRAAKRIYGGDLPARMIDLLDALTQIGFSMRSGDLQIIDGNWYVTHTGLLRLARRRRCRGIHVEAVDSLCDSATSRFVLKATVYPSKGSSGFVGYGDADPSNVSPRVHGAEMRMAETRAVNRALRKAYGVGICSAEEIGSFAGPIATGSNAPKIPPNGSNRNGAGSCTRVRDRLCQIIRQHNLDPELVKAYAVDFCGTKALRDATREQVENFVQHLADAATRDRNSLLCHLNSYARPSQAVVA